MSISVIDEKEWKGNTIVLGKDNYQHMIGFKCLKCINKYSDQAKIHWRKFFTNLPPAGQYGGSLGLARAYFSDPDAISGEFGDLVMVDHKR